VVKKQSFTSIDLITKLLAEQIPTSKLLYNFPIEVSYLLPHSEAKNFSHLFELIEENKLALGIQSFGISITKLEDVFLQVVHGQKSALENGEAAGEVGEADEELLKTNTQSQILMPS